MSLPGSGGDRTALVTDAVRAAKAGGADLVVLPEATLPGYAHRRTDATDAARSLAGALARDLDIHVAIGFLDGDGCALGLAGPGTWAAYQKRFPSPAESRAWAPGAFPAVVPTPFGPVGLAICADVLQLSTWAELAAAQVVAVLVAGAWPAYATPAPPGLGWLWRDSNAYRDDLLARASRSLGAPVAFANASGPLPGGDHLAGGATAWSGGQVFHDPHLVVVEAVRGPPGPALTHQGAWRAFAPTYRLAARVVHHTSRLPR